MLGITATSIFSSGVKKSRIQIFLNIEILLTIFYIYKNKLAKRNLSFASLKEHLKTYRDEMCNKSRAYSNMKNTALKELGTDYSRTYI